MIGRAVVQKLLVQSPLLLVYIVGAVLSLVFWRRHPKVSGLTLVAMILLIFTSVVSAGINVWLPRYFFQQHYSRSSESAVYAVVNTAIGVVRAMGIGLLLAAVFSMRSGGQPDYASRLPGQMPPSLPPRYQ